MFDCVIKNGILVTSPQSAKSPRRARSASQNRLCRSDIGIQDGKIVAIAPNLGGREIINADGMLVIPGGVDPHVHLEMPAGKMVTSDTWETGSRATAFGGTTTVIDFIEPAFLGQPLLDSFKERQRQAQGYSWVDYSFHMTLCDADDTTLRQIPWVINAGIPSFKLYTTYSGFRLDDTSLLLALEAIGKAGGVAMVHAESDAIIQHATHRLQAAGCLAVRHFPESRPPLAEVEAIERVLSLAKYTAAPVYLVHISTRAGTAAIARAHQDGQLAWGETCPQYLLLDQTRILTNDFNGAKYICCPPLREKTDQQALWSALQTGKLHTIGSDHCAFNYYSQKDTGKESFLEIPSGLPGIELRLALIYTFGVLQGRITLQQWVDLCCTAPARLFGLHPQKGELVVGADADIVLFDTTRTAVITREILHENVDYTPYEGLALTGRVDTTLLRGQVLVRAGNWVGKTQAGQAIGSFIAGTPPLFSTSIRMANESISKC
jgi:dihydropyrimidinase